MVTKRARVESRAFHNGADLAKVHFGRISTIMKRVENRVH